MAPFRCVRELCRGPGSWGEGGGGKVRVELARAMIVRKSKPENRGLSPKWHPWYLKAQQGPTEGTSYQ